MHKLFDALEAVQSGDYKVAQGARLFGRYSHQCAVRINGLYIRTPFNKLSYDAEAPDGWMHRQMPSCLIDDLQCRFFGIQGAFANGEQIRESSEWLQCNTTSFSKVGMDDSGGLADDLQPIVDRFGAGAAVSRRYFPYVRHGGGAHSITLLTVKFTISDAVMFKLAHIGQ
ncbi:hypothetical protein [Roseicella aerolata]|uniref:Uncharacterized protein n=1 Tax=Roseicella aerolata TaxID=2883479 RepID=A0A9X1LAY6_9PROT|nr:hypothetical protein [Roseicella aerolata]MCB4825551.1 hypothetical protein [Roseicella aerolata]